MPRLGRYFQCQIAVDVQMHGQGAEVAMPDPAHAGESIAPNEYPTRFAVHPTDRNTSAPEDRPRLLQNTAKPHRPDLARETADVIGFDRKGAKSRRAVRRFEFRARQLAQEAIERLVLIHTDD